MLTFEPVQTQEQIDTVVAIAEAIWPATYEPITPPGQVEYMLDKFQSDHAIKDQMAHQNYQYYLALFDGTPGGFVGFAPRYEGREEMFLSKLYILPRYRGAGAARALVELVTQHAKAENLPLIRLTVNKQNTHAVSVYKALGFVISELAVSDIGGGYVMDDYIMTKEVP